MSVLDEHHSATAPVAMVFSSKEGMVMSLIRQFSTTYPVTAWVVSKLLTVLVLHSFVRG